MDSLIYIDALGSGDTSDSFMYYRNKNDKGYGLPTITDELVLTQSLSVVSYCNQHGYKVKIFSEYVNLQVGIGLYELFSYFYEGKVEKDLDMVELLFEGLLADSPWCFCLKLGVSFCWFTVGETSLCKLGTMQFSEAISKYSVGRFMKRLRYNIAKSGINLFKVRYLIWDSQDLGAEFLDYLLSYNKLVDFFSRIEGLKDRSIYSVMRLLSNNLLLRYSPSAEKFVDCLNDGFQQLGLREESGVLYSKDIYYKDYSNCTSNIVDFSKCSYGIIIDCEGVEGVNGSLKNGVRELGGIIYCKYGNILLKLDLFVCDGVLLGDTLLQVVKNYKGFTSGFSRYINVITFGKSDEIMLKAGLKSTCSKRDYKMFDSVLNFHDCSSYINSYITENNIEVDGHHTLTNLAKALQVLPLYPKHKPLNDARTLFNILSRVLYDTERFVV